MEIYRADTIDIENLIEFSVRCPWKPEFSEQVVRRFLTNLISSQKMVFDLHDKSGRVAAAVLLDKVDNPANDACLEILGARADVAKPLLFEKFIAFSKENIPAHRAGFQVGTHESFGISQALVAKHGLQHSYDTFEMLHSKTMEQGHQSHREIVDAVVDDKDIVFRVLGDSFAQNPETSIPDAEVWKTGFLKSPKSHYYLWRAENKVMGFAQLIENDGETEVNIIGVLPEFRGRKIGHALLEHCLSESARLGFDTCRLTVGVKNERALGIYLRAGFQQVDRYSCYRFSGDRHSR